MDKLRAGVGDLARRTQFVRDHLGKQLPHVAPIGQHALDAAQMGARRSMACSAPLRSVSSAVGY